MRNKTALTMGIAFLLVSVIISIFFERTSKGKEIGENKKLKNILIYAPLALGLACVLYYATEFINDFLYAVIISTAITAILALWDRYSKNYKYKIVVEGILIWSILFICIRIINKYLIIPISHNWIIVLAINIIRTIFSKDNGKTSERAFVANVVGIIILFFMFNYFSEPFGGFGKAEIIGKKYLIENGVAKEEDKIRIDRLIRDDENISLFVSINETKFLTLNYEMGEINNIYNVTE